MTKIKPNVVRGGKATNIGGNLYYMSGRKHSAGGIDIGDTLEVEGGEVVQTTPKEVRVFSAQPILNGNSPAKLVMGGANPNDVFNAQEQFKDRTGLNDDGTKKQNGGTVKPKFEDWYKTVPIEINDTTNYNLRKAYDYLPYDELETWKQGKGHLRSIFPTKDGNYEFLKSKNHPTYNKEIQWYNSSKGSSFRKEYKLDDSTEYPKYIKRDTKRMGGLSRDKDYGSRKKPYTNVDKSDFAGGGRSYPIPTRADAVDALRLAGFHGRSDVKAKVYAKYPDLKRCGGRKKATGGIVTVNGNVIDKLVGDVSFPSPTGGRKKAALGTDKRDKDYVVMNGQLYQVTNDKFGETAYLPVDERIPNSRLLDGREAAARKSDRQVQAAAKRDAKSSVANSSIPKGNNFIEPFNPVQYRATGNSAGSRSTNNSGSNKEFTVRRGSYDTRYPDASSYARDAAAQRKQVNDAARRDAKGARTDFRDMLEVPEFAPGTYSGGNRNAGTKSTNSATQTRVTPIEEAPATTAATKASKPATSSAPRRRSGSSKSTKAPATATPTAAPKFASLDSMMQGLPTLSRNTPTTIPTRTVDGASTNTGVPDTISSPRKRLALFDKLDTNDIIGLGANLAGTIASGVNTRKALNNMEAPPQPNSVVASNLKTDFNISPQLGEIEENARRMATDINANTSSSRTRLQRLQRTRNQAQNSKNSLRGQKENIETQLINQDRLNKQGVRATNVAAMNDWQNRSAAFRNSIREQKASSLNNVFSGINAGLQDMLSRIENRRNYNNTLDIYDATHPNVDRRLFTSKGVTF